MANWNKPDIDSDYLTEVLQELLARETDAATLFYNTGSTNIPVHSIRWNRATNAFQEWSGSAWADLASGLTLGTMATQDNDAVSITGGSIGTAVNIDAARLTSNLVPTARLGSGSALDGSSLAGDRTWKSFPPIGTGAIWFIAAAPTGWLILNGQLVSRTTYAVLFALWGTTYGAGDGSTTFGVPDLRGFFPFGKAASGTGSTLGGTFGAIDHLHTGPSHTHTISSDGGHSHTVASHTHSVTDHIHGGTGHTHGISGSGGHTHTGTTNGPNDGGAAHYGSGTPENDSSTTTHGHTFTTDSGGDHSHGGSTASGGDVNSQGIVGGAPASGAATPATDSQGAHTHTGATGAAGTGNTGTSNPPGFAVNFIVKAL